MSAKPQLFFYLLSLTGNHLKTVTFGGGEKVINVEKSYVLFLYYCFEYITVFANNTSQELSNLSNT